MFQILTQTLPSSAKSKDRATQLEYQKEILLSSNSPCLEQGFAHTYIPGLVSCGENSQRFFHFTKFSGHMDGLLVILQNAGRKQKAQLNHDWKRKRATFNSFKVKLYCNVLPCQLLPFEEPLNKELKEYCGVCECTQTRDVYWQWYKGS